MAAADDIKSSLDLSQIAQFLGTDEQTADAAVDQALNQLVGAMGANAADTQSAVGLSRAAINDHLEGSAYGETIDINAIDAADGEKIVNHLLEPNQIQTLSSGSGGGLLQRLLPILAPIVMGYIASKLQEKMAGGGQATTAEPAESGGGLGDILGGLLGGLFGGSSAAEQPATPTSPSGGTGGFQVPQGGGGGLQIDPGQSTSTSSQQPRASSGGDLLGGLLKDILGGR